MSQILVLNGSDVRELLPVGDAIDAIERAFRDIAEGSAQMPPKLYLDFPQFQGDLRIMPAAFGSEYAGVKVVNSHARNPEQGLPAVMGTYLLASQSTGSTLAILDATYLTAARTGAASALASRYLARQVPSTVGLVGAGAQARWQIEAISEVAKVNLVKVWAPARDSERLRRFVGEMSGLMADVEWAEVDEVADAAEADIICTTTPSRFPVLMDGWVKPGTHINAVGADGPGKQELDPAILRRARVIVDEIEQARHGGEVNVPLAKGEITEADIDGSLADVVSGRIRGRTSDDEVTVFDSTGLAIEDLAVAALVYERALDKGMGTRLDLKS